MKCIRSVEDMQVLVKQLQREGKSVGFVPTMGFLHEGHQTLMQAARKENDVVISSIFVNPLQFGPNEDFETYPRDEARDLEVAQSEKVDFLFLPQVDEVYPNKLSITMKVNDRVDKLCGAKREGHFDGVATILTKLFNIIAPDRVYFGLKDAQQVAVVDALIQDYNFPIDLRPVPTVRESDGLAKSSRNVYLSTEERSEANALFQALEHGRNLVSEGETNKKRIIEEVSHFINKQTHGKIDYVDLLTYPHLEDLEEIQGQVILATAVQFNSARLIDNIIFDKSGSKITEVLSRQ